MGKNDIADFRRDITAKVEVDITVEVRVQHHGGQEILMKVRMKVLEKNQTEVEIKEVPAKIR